MTAVMLLACVKTCSRGLVVIESEAYHARSAAVAEIFLTVAPISAVRAQGYGNGLEDQTRFRLKLV